VQSIDLREFLFQSLEESEDVSLLTLIKALEEGSSECPLKV
jgi:hypothetical protein